MTPVLDSRRGGDTQGAYRDEPSNDPTLGRGFRFLDNNARARAASSRLLETWQVRHTARRFSSPSAPPSKAGTTWSTSEAATRQSGPPI